MRRRLEFLAAEKEDKEEEKPSRSRRQRLIGELCDRMSAGLETAVGALEEALGERGARPAKDPRHAGPAPAPSA
jgi:hypothetical protein